MSVVQRCPSCGTTQPASGECDTCHEAHVRLFCTNHSPGLWLTAPTCPSCGARFGGPALRPPTPATTVRPPTPATIVHEAAAEARSSRERPPPAGDEELEVVTSPMELWQRLLRASVRARSAPATWTADSELPRIARNAGGCLTRFVLVVVLLFVALVAAAFLVGHALLQGF
jgi:ribosomal protein L37AE/L43A